MSKKEQEQQAENTERHEEKQESTYTAEAPSDTETENEEQEKDPLAEMKAEYDQLNDKYLRLYSEFENFRKRTAKERLDLMKTAGEDVFKLLLPILDDFERAQANMDNAKDVKSVKEGVELIHNKLLRELQNKGLKAMESKGETFDPEFHEAITQIPAPKDDLKGKVVDEVEKGYFLHEKVIRFAKVVVGA